MSLLAGGISENVAADPKSLNRGFTVSRKRRKPVQREGAGVFCIGTVLEVMHHLTLTFGRVSDTLFAVSLTFLRSLSCVDFVGFRG